MSLPPPPPGFVLDGAPAGGEAPPSTRVAPIRAPFPNDLFDKAARIDINNKARRGAARTDPGGFARPTDEIMGEHGFPPRTSPPAYSSAVGQPEDLSLLEKYVAPVLEKLMPNGRMPVGSVIPGVPTGATVDPRNNPVTQGMADPGTGIAQIIANLFGQGDKSNPMVEANEAGYQASRGADAGSFDLARTVVNAVNPLALKGAGMIPKAAVSTVPKAMGTGAAVGAAQGATQPVTSGEPFWGEKGEQTGAGGAAGGLLPMLAAAVKKVGAPVWHGIDARLPGGKERAAGRMANEVAGARAPAVRAELAKSQEIVPGSKPTAGEAATAAGSAEFSGLEKVVRAKAGAASDFAQRSKEQQGARRAAVQSVGKTEADLNAARANRAENAKEGYDRMKGVRVDPRSDVKIMDDAIEGRYQSKASALQDEGRFRTEGAQQQERADNWTPVPGMPRVPGRYSENAERVAPAAKAGDDAKKIAGMRQDEMEFLGSTMNTLRDTVGMSEKSLTPLLKRPSMREAVKAAIKGAGETGEYFPRKKGDKFSIDNLQRMKMALDKIVANPKDYGLEGVEAKEINDTRKAFVEWLSNRSPDWKAARLQYREDSIPINQMEVGQQLEKSLTNNLSDGETAKQFANAVENAPGTIKKATGQPRYEKLEEVLDPKQMDAINRVSRDLERKAQFEDLAKKGQSAAAETMGTDAIGQLPNTLDHTVTLINRVLSKLDGRAIATKELAVKMRDPAEMARIMKAMTPAERGEFTALLSSGAGAATGREAADAEKRPVRPAPTPPPTDFIKPAAQPAAAPAAPARRYPAVPRNAAAREVGATYSTPKGDFKWNGKTWTRP